MIRARVRSAVAINLAFVVCGCHRQQPFTRASVVERLRGEHPGVALPSDELPAGVIAEEELVYARRGARALALDVYRPRGEGRHPAVIVVHGGGWQSGDRTMERPLAKRLAALGYVAAPVTYRLGPDGRFPAALHDLKAAVRWLRRHAGRHGVDPAHVGAIGGSAGGQLVALLGATNGLPAFDGDASADEGDAASLASPAGSDVQAVVDIDGVADFTGPALLEKEARDPASPTRFLGGPYASHAETWRAASAITHVRAASAPTLFLCSEAPTPILPGRPEMCARLRAAGVDCELHVTRGAPHPFWLVDPWFEPTLARADAFLRKHLR